MDHETLALLNALLILLVALLQFMLRRGSQTEGVKDLEARLEEAEQSLALIQARLERRGEDD